MIGVVKQNKVGTNRDGTNQVRLLDVEMTDPQDIQTVELMSDSGDDAPPIEGSKVVVIQAGKAWKIAIAIDDGITPTVEAGEKKIYSSDSGSIQAYIHLKKDGNIDVVGNADVNIQGSDDYAVAYNDLKTAFDQLKTDLNNLITAYNSHIHITTATIGASPTPGVISPTTSTGTPSSADMTGSKVDNVRLP